MHMKLLIVLRRCLIVWYYVYEYAANMISIRANHLKQYIMNTWWIVLYCIVV